MAQYRLNSTNKDKQLRHELYTLLQEGLNKNGDSNYSHVNQGNQELSLCGNDINLNERVGLYY
ncbi:MAG: hypothetical protein HFJ09_02985 [Lachnospiraceae bacterium]|nr:hypothetical protein [Lachnospiraceae bacterium]